VALWPDEAMRRRLVALQAGLGGGAGGARLTPAADLHLTLVFIGQLPSARLAEVRAGVAALAPAPPCELELDALERWPGGLIVITATALPPALLHTRQALEEALRARGLPFDTRPFRPHVTLARRMPARAQLPPYQPLRWRCGGPALAVRGAAGYRMVP
jgi:2'-5' RNA ligase